MPNQQILEIEFEPVVAQVKWPSQEIQILYFHGMWKMGSKLYVKHNSAINLGRKKKENKNLELMICATRFYNAKGLSPKLTK